MALKDLSINQSATQLVADINSNIEEVGGSASVSADGSATSLVGVLNDVFDGVTGAEELSVGDSATDFVDKLNGNFEAAASGSPAREFEDLLVLATPTSSTSEMVPDYKGEKFYLIYRDSASPVMPSVTTHYEFYDANEENPTSAHNVSVWRCPKAGKMTIGNSLLPAYSLKNSGIMVSRSRSRCYVNPKYRWVLFGDSITAYTYSSALGKDVNAGYSWIIGEANHEIAVQNLAVSGKSIMNAGGMKSVVESTDFSPYDICSILIGANDWTYSYRGEGSYTYNGITKTGFNNFKEAYKNVLDYIFTQKPNIKLFVCTLIQRGDRNDSDEMCAVQGATIRDLANNYMLNGVAHPIPVLDLTELCELDLSDPAQQNYSAVNENGHDRLHPTQEAHELFLAPLFKAKLMKVLNDYTLFPDILELENFEDI